MNKIGYALRVAQEYYDKETLDHVIRVACLVNENTLIPEKNMDDCIALAIMHDLLEDTDCKIETLQLDTDMIECLKLLTINKGDDYIEYIINIRSNATSFRHQNAYWVKLADMKDHLLQTETLTDKLKEKYLRAIPYLL